MKNNFIKMDGTFQESLALSDLEELQALGGLTLWRLTLQNGRLVLEADQSFLTAFGYMKESFPESFNDFVVTCVHPEDQDAVSETAAEIFDRLSARTRLEYRVRHAVSGQWRWVRSHGLARIEEAEGKISAVGCTLDIHEYFTALDDLRTMREKLHSERDKMAAIIEAADMTLWDWNLETDEIIYGVPWPGAGRASGGDTADSIWPQLITPQDRQRSREAAARHARGEFPSYEMEYQMQRPDGKLLWVQSRGRVVERDELGRAKRMMGVLMDVTAQKLNERALSAQQEQMDMIINAAKVGAWDWDVARNHLTFNTTYTAMLGYEPGELDGSIERWRSYVHPDDLEDIARPFQDVFTGPGLTYENTLRMRHKDGRYLATHDVGRVVETTPDGREALRIVGIQVLLLKDRQSNAG